MKAPERKALEAELFGLLSSKMLERGFTLTKIPRNENSPSYKAFVRGTKSYSQSIIPLLTSTKFGDHIRLEFFLRVKIFRVLEFLRDYLSSLPDPRMKWVDGTSGCLLTNLRVHGDEYDWRFSKPSDISLHLPDFIERLDRLAIPFLERYSSEVAVAEQIEKSIGNRRVQIPMLRTADRGQILLAIYLLHEEFDKFKRMVPVMRDEIAKDNGGYFLPSYDAIVSAMQNNFR